jgi:hypothetical protein
VHAHGHGRRRPWVSWSSSGAWAASAARAPPGSPRACPRARAAKALGELVIVAGLGQVLGITTPAGTAGGGHGGAAAPSGSPSGAPGRPSRRSPRARPPAWRRRAWGSCPPSRASASSTGPAAPTITTGRPAGGGPASESVHMRTAAFLRPAWEPGEPTGFAGMGPFPFADRRCRPPPPAAVQYPRGVMCSRRHTRPQIGGAHLRG